MCLDVRKDSPLVLANIGVHTGVEITFAMDRGDGEGAAIHLGPDGPDVITYFADLDSLERLAAVATDGARQFRDRITANNQAAAETSDAPGLPKLIDDYRGEPPTLRWLLIQRDGRTAELTSDNIISWSLADELWVQPLLLRDVYREVDPTNRQNLTGAATVPTEHGVVITVSHDETPINPVATGMLAELGVEKTVYGTVAWLGDRQPDTGLHGDLEDDQRATLLAMADRHTEASS